MVTSPGPFASPICIRFLKNAWPGKPEWELSIHPWKPEIPKRRTRGDSGASFLSRLIPTGKILRPAQMFRGSVILFRERNPVSGPHKPIEGIFDRESDPVSPRHQAGLQFQRG